MKKMSEEPPFKISFIISRPYAKSGLRSIRSQIWFEDWENFKEQMDDQVAQIEAAQVKDTESRKESNRAQSSRISPKEKRGCFN